MIQASRPARPSQGTRWQRSTTLPRRRPGLTFLPALERPGGRHVTLTPGRALITLLGELSTRDLPVRGMTLTRLQGALTLPGGLAVSYCCGWLVWPAGRPSSRGRPLHTLHNAHDPAGAARRLTQYWRDGAGGRERS